MITHWSLFSSFEPFSSKFIWFGFLRRCNPGLSCIWFLVVDGFSLVVSGHWCSVCLWLNPILCVLGLTMWLLTLLRLGYRCHRQFHLRPLVGIHLLVYSILLLHLKKMLFFLMIILVLEAYFTWLLPYVPKMTFFV